MLNSVTCVPSFDTYSLGLDPRMSALANSRAPLVASAMPMGRGAVQCPNFPATATFRSVVGLPEPRLDGAGTGERHWSPVKKKLRELGHGRDGRRSSIFGTVRQTRTRRHPAH